MNERTLARACDAGDDDQHTEWNVDVHFAEIVGVRAANFEHLGEFAYGFLQRCPIVEMPTGDGVAPP